VSSWLQACQSLFTVGFGITGNFGTVSNLGRVLAAQSAE
jgi:hypothetical protein